MPDDFEDDFEGDEGDELSPEELREQLAAERARNAALQESQERDAQRLDTMLRGQPAQRQEASRPLGPPPNPADDPDAFNRWMADRDARHQAELETRLARSTQEVRDTVSTETRQSRLWSRFQQKYPVYAERQALVNAAFNDLQRENKLPANDEAIVDAVRKRMDQMAGLVIDRASVNENRAHDPARDARPGRRRGKEAAEEKVVTLSDAIYNRQVAAGLR